MNVDTFGKIWVASEAGTALSFRAWNDSERVGSLSRLQLSELAQTALCGSIAPLCLKELRAATREEARFTAKASAGKLPALPALFLLPSRPEHRCRPGSGSGREVRGGGGGGGGLVQN